MALRFLSSLRDWTQRCVPHSMGSRPWLQPVAASRLPPRSMGSRPWLQPVAASRLSRRSMGLSPLRGCRDRHGYFTRCGPVPKARHDLVPKARKDVATGVSPWIGGPRQSPSPEGATGIVGAACPVVPPGLDETLRSAFHGLTPMATSCRRFAAAAAFHGPVAASRLSGRSMGLSPLRGCRGVPWAHAHGYNLPPLRGCRGCAAKGPGTCVPGYQLSPLRGCRAARVHLVPPTEYRSLKPTGKPGPHWDPTEGTQGFSAEGTA